MMVLSSIVDISERKQREERIMLALKEKELLLGEIHHRVKNNLQIVNSLLELQFARLNDPALQSMLRESQNRVRTMALIHQTLYQSGNFAEVDFGRFLDSLVPTLISSYGIDPDRVRLEVDAAGVLLPINAAIPCGVLVNELISNALKHAFPDGLRGTIQVSLARVEAGHVRLAVADDGIGIAEDLDIGATRTLGLQLVTLLAEQLGAEMTVQRRQPTSFELRFPVAK
jgi:two-component sensor histidine kinase